MEKRLLIDTFSFKPQVLEDNRSRGGKLIARGEFARADLATENKRVYPRTLWERELTRLAKQISERKVYGELDHPMDGRTQLKRVSHIISGLRLENGVVVGEAEILDTTEGMNLRKILEAGGAVGVSSRGFGTTRPNMKGEDVVQDDYRLMTFDFVAEPANVTSYPTIHAESKTKTPVPARKAETVMIEDKTMNLEQLRAQHPALYENFMRDAEKEFDKKGAELWAKKIIAAKQEAQTDLRAQFAEKLEQTLANARKDIAEQERAKLMADPAVAAAKEAMESLKSVLRPFVVPGDVESVVKEKETVIEQLQKKLADQELRIVKVMEENEKLANIAKEAGYRFHLEKLLSGSSQADTIRKIVGDVKQYESTEAINVKVTEIVEQFKSASKTTEERDAEMAKLREENEKLRIATEKSIEATRQLMVQAYAEQRLANHPRAAEARVMIESKQPASKEEVDSLLSKIREPRRDQQSLDEARARIRQLAGGAATRESLIEHEERGNTGAPKNGTDNYNGLEADIDSLRTLSGIGGTNN